MYRIFCESYDNFIKSFEKESERLKIAKPFELIINPEQYNKEKNIVEESQLEEQTKLINSFLKLAYWY